MSKVAKPRFGGLCILQLLENNPSTAAKTEVKQLKHASCPGFQRPKRSRNGLN